MRTLHQSFLCRLLSVGSDVQTGRRRHRTRRPKCVPRMETLCIIMSLQKSVFQLADEQSGKMHIFAFQGLKRDCRQSALKHASDSIRYLGVMLYDADKVEEAASLKMKRICITHSWRFSLTRMIRT